jgi:glutamate/tyrosine decarboxylase-like PLP-dependent enzyme
VSDVAALLLSAAERGSRYRESLAGRRVAPEASALARLGALGGTLPEDPSDAAFVLALLDEVGSPATVATAGGRYFGFVVGSSLPAALAANWLAGAWDQNASVAVMSPAAVALEEIALGWTLDVLGLERSCGGAFVTGATMANFAALCAARGHLLAKLGWDADADGLFGAPPIQVVVSEQAHVTVHKALGLLGLGRERVVRVPTDAQGRMRADALPRLADPAIVCVQAGNVNSGAFDPAAEICARAHEAGAWVHVDGAFGLWAAAAPERAHLAAGFAAADSWATDAHKWLNVPYDCGIAIVRDAAALRRAMSVEAPYFGASGGREPRHFTPETSRRARGVEVWAALRALGRRGLADLVERSCRHAARFAEGLAAAGHLVLNDVVLNQVLVRFGSAATTERVIEALQRDGTCWCGATRWQGETAMRISVSSYATTNEDVETSLAAMLRIAAEVLREGDER